MKTQQSTWPELFAYHNGRLQCLLLFPLLVSLMLLSAVGCQANGGFDPIGALTTPRPTATPEPTLPPEPTISLQEAVPLAEAPSTQPTPDLAATAWAAATRAAQPTATPIINEGEARSKPLPVGSLVEMENWSVQVLDVIRGEAAWQLIQQANSLNDPPPAGREYLLVQFWLKNQSESEGRIWPEITGNRHNVYKHFRTGVVVPSPRLETTLPSGAENLGWLAYNIAADESNLLLRLVDGIDLQATAVYVALVEGASVSRAPALDSIAPTEWGNSAAEPLVLGQIATTDDWQIQVKEVILGEAAYAQLLDRNRFNDPPEPGMKYGLVYLWLRYIGPGESSASITPRAIQTLGPDGTIYDQPVLVLPEPELRGDLYPGGEIEGWVAIQIPEAENAPLLQIEPARGQIRYLSLATRGR